MRLSVDPKSPHYSPDVWAPVDVYYKGRVVQFVMEIDTRAGWYEGYRVDDEGKVEAHPVLRKAIRERKYGEVAMQLRLFA